MGLGGLALANSLAVSAEVLVLLLLLRRRWKGVEGRQILSVLVRVILATLLMGIAVTGVLELSRRTTMGPFWTLALGGAAGLLAYAAAGLLLRVRALRWLLEALLNR